MVVGVRNALLEMLLLVATVSAKSYEVPGATSDITINTDSTFDVVETWRYSFDGDFSAVDRVIYLQGIDDISDIQAFEGGAPMDFDVSRSSGQVMVTLNFAAHNEDKEFTIKYKVHGGMNYFSDLDAFYWKAIPAERDVPIGHVKVVLHFPAPLDANATEIALHTNAQNARHYFIDARTLAFEGDNVPVGDEFEVGATMP